MKYVEKLNKKFNSDDFSDYIFPKLNHRDDCYGYDCRIHFTILNIMSEIIREDFKSFTPEQIECYINLSRRTFDNGYLTPRSEHYGREFL